MELEDILIHAAIFYIGYLVAKNNLINLPVIHLGNGATTTPPGTTPPAGTGPAPTSTPGIAPGEPNPGLKGLASMGSMCI